MAYGYVAHVDAVGNSSTTGVGLDAQHAVEVRGVHAAVFGEDILYACAYLATDDHAAMSVFHRTATDDDVF